MPDDIIQFILILSIALQFLAAGYALRLIPLTHRKTAWILISAALILMGARRLIGIFGLSEKLGSYIFLMEVVALIISILMMIGVVTIRALFQNLNDSLQKLQQFQQILENTSDLVATWDPKGRVRYLNRSARGIIGLPQGDLPADLRIDALLSGESLREIQETALPQGHDHDSWHGTTVLKANERSDPRHISHVVIAQPDGTDHDPAFYSTIGRDITERIEFEDQLAELNQCRQNLLNILAHDLRGPVGNAITLIQLLREGLHEATREEMEALLGKSQESMENTYSMMERLLEWARSQTGQLEIDRQSCDLNQFVKTLLAEMDSELQQKGINLRIDIPASLPVETDPGLCGTILRNLIANAIKFSPCGGTLTVQARSLERVVELSIRDNGPGIPSALLEKIKRGLPVDSSPGSSGEKGNGLGLSMCHSLMDTLRKVWPVCALTIADSSPQGTTMVLTFPATPKVGT